MNIILYYKRKRMSKIERISIDLDQFAAVFGDNGPAKWRLRRADGLLKMSNDIKWIEFNEDGTFKEDHGHDFAIGRSLLMSPFNEFFTWQTTPMIEIVSIDFGQIVFKTKNSIYTLSTIEDEFE